MRIPVDPGLTAVGYSGDNDRDSTVYATISTVSWFTGHRTVVRASQRTGLIVPVTQKPNHCAGNRGC